MEVCTSEAVGLPKTAGVVLTKKKLRAARRRTKKEKRKGKELLQCERR